MVVLMYLSLAGISSCVSCFITDDLTLPTLNSETMRQYAPGEEDDDLLPNDIPSDNEFDDYEFGK